MQASRTGAGGFDWQGPDKLLACVRIMRPNDVNLYLVGFMGTGKTTVSRIVAARLGHRWVDSDHEIERLQGKSIADIFATEGEPAFRRMERDFVVGGHPLERTVVACGGGLVVQPGLLAELQKRGVVICLHATVETILRRTAHSRARPLLNVEDPEQRIRDLYTVRDPVYRNAGSVILTDNRPQLEVVQHVLRVYRRDSLDFSRARGGASPAAGGAKPAGNHV
jgi:shikimate kinase